MKRSYEADVRIIKAMASETEGFTGELVEMGENSIKLGMSQYEILIDLPYDYSDKDLSYSVSTIRYEDEEETERNMREAKTERGLRNYIHKFSN